jgi:hypothetical protein
MTIFLVLSQIYPLQLLSSSIILLHNASTSVECSFKANVWSLAVVWRVVIIAACFESVCACQTTAKDHTLALKEHSTEVDALYNKIIELESRIEGQEQYSRRTSLRFHKIKVPVDERGNVKHPVNTDELLLKKYTTIRCPVCV